MSIRVGIIGCGKIAQVRHIPEYLANPHAEIYGYYDINLARAEEMAAKYGGKAFASYEELLADQLFRKKNAEVIFAVEDGKEVGFALYFHNFSTFLGRSGLYLEDLFVYPEYRGKGYGKAILKRLAAIAVERGCGRLEWACLDWNQPSIDFYRSLGALPMDEWTVYRMAGEKLKEFAE
mgnify:CR=1 FL=1